MKKITFLILALSFTLSTWSQDLKAYQLYNQKGKKVTFKKMIRKLAHYDVVLFGEFHDNSIIHWMELKTAEALYHKTEGNMVLGAEMFERDNQPQINAYLQDSIDAKQLETQARLWNNFKTDYKPLLDFAQKYDLPFIASNVPRSYAQIVAAEGLDSLDALPVEEKVYLAELPINFSMETPGYKEMEDMMRAHAGDKLMNYIHAQAVKDATMAESIIKNSTKPGLFLHFNGDYHSKEYGGIYWYLKNQDHKKLKVAVIAVVSTDHPELRLPKELKHTEFTIVVPEDMTKTY